MHCNPNVQNSYSYYGLRYLKKSPVQNAILAEKSGSCQSGPWLTHCGVPRHDYFLGQFPSREKAMEYSENAFPYLKYKICNVHPTDQQKLFNWTDVPTHDLYNQEGVSSCYYTKRDCDWKNGYKCVGAEPPYRMGNCEYKQEGLNFWRDKYEYPLPGDYKGDCPLNLSETQMLAPPIHSCVELNLSPIEKSCGGQYTVDKVSRKVIKVPYHMGPSDGYPTYEDALYAAQNTFLPQGITNYRSL